MKRIVVYLSLLLGLTYTQQSIAQLTGIPKAHSHNDYEQKRPFELAYENGFASIEADVWLKENILCVAHDAKDINTDRTLENLYFKKINDILQKNKGVLYKDKTELQLLIDIKSEYKSTLNALIALLSKYPLVRNPKKIKIVISGNRPPPTEYASYPSYLYFDGRPNEEYDKKSLKKVGLISDSYLKYSKWMGNGPLPDKDKSVLQSIVQKSHSLKKPFRFWATPDNENSWNTFMELGVDYINTDKVEALAKFLSTKNN